MTAPEPNHSPINAAGGASPRRAAASATARSTARRTAQVAEPLDPHQVSVTENYRLISRGTVDAGQFVRVAHRVEVADPAVGDLDGDDALEAVAEVEHQRGGVVVDGRLDAAALPGHADQADDHSGHPLARRRWVGAPRCPCRRCRPSTPRPATASTSARPRHRLTPRRRTASVISMDCLRVDGLEPLAPRLHVFAGAVRHLTHRRRGFADGRGDLVVAEPEHLVQDEDRALVRAQRLQHHQHRHRNRFGQNHIGRGVPSIRAAAARAATGRRSPRACGHCARSALSDCRVTSWAR